MVPSSLSILFCRRFWYSLAERASTSVLRMPAERNGPVSTPWALIFSSCFSVVGVSYSDSAIKAASTSLADQAAMFWPHCDAWKKMTSAPPGGRSGNGQCRWRSEEHTSELQSRENLVCRLLLEKKKKTKLRWWSL